MKFDFGQVLERTAQITWKHKAFWLFYTIPVLLSFATLLVLVMPIFFLAQNENERMATILFLVSFAVFAAIIILTFLLTTFGNTSLALGVLRADRGEGSLTFMDLLRDGLKYFKQVLSVTLIIQSTFGLASMLFFLLMFIMIIVTIGMASICFQPIMILLGPLSFLVVAVLEGSIVAVIEENLSAMDAIKRAMRVVRNHVWTFILLTVIIFFGSSIISSFLVVPLMIPAFAIPAFIASGADVSGRAIVLIFILSSAIFLPLFALFSGILSTFMATALELTYLRLANPSENELPSLESATPK